LTAICVGRVTVTTTSTPRYAASRSTLRSTTRMWVRGCVRPTGAGSTRRRPSSLRSQWWRSAARRRSTRRGRCWRDPAGGVRGDRRTTAMWSNLSSIQAMVTDRGPEACSRDLVTFGWCYASRSECWVLCSGRAWWVPVDWPGMVKVGVGQWQLAHRQLGDGCEARGEPAGQRVCMRRTAVRRRSQPGSSSLVLSRPDRVGGVEPAPRRRDSAGLCCHTTVNPNPSTPAAGLMDTPGRSDAYASAARSSPSPRWPRGPAVRVLVPSSWDNHTLLTRLRPP
jgi:hypothetical protein